MTMRLDPATTCRMFARHLELQGKRCDVEAGADGAIVYASTRVDAMSMARIIQRVVLGKDPQASVVGPELAPEEPETTSWWAEVSFDWRRIG